MAIDLGISHEPHKPVVDISAGNKAAPVSPKEEREGQRAFLGCYYLSIAYRPGPESGSVEKNYQKADTIQVFCRAE